MLLNFLWFGLILLAFVSDLLTERHFRLVWQDSAVRGRGWNWR